MSEGQAGPDPLATALDLVAESGWDAYSPLRLAETAGIGLAEACTRLPDQGAILRALGHRADAAMLDLRADELMAMTPKERLFELIMRRLEALTVARPALRRLGREASPEAWLAALGSLRRALRRLVQASDAAPGGLRGLVAGAALAAAYLRVGRVWLDDDSADLAPTMAALNDRLDEVARFVR